MQTEEATQKTRSNRKRTRMKVWMFSIDAFNYSEYHIPNAKDREFFDKLCVPQIIKNQLLVDIWKPMTFMKRRQRKNADFTFVGNAGLAMSKKAVEALAPLIESSVEILPLKTLAREPFFFINVMESIDALDEEKTVFQYSSVSKTKIGIEKFVFDEEKIKNKHFFKIKGFWYNTFVSDEFRAACKKHDLQGLDFTRQKLIWKQ